MGLEVDSRPSSTTEAVSEAPRAEVRREPSPRMLATPVLLRDAPLVPPPTAGPTEAPMRRDDRRSWLRLDWRTKALIQKTLGLLPGGVELHYLLQCAGGGLGHFDRECDVKVDDWSLMMGQLRLARVDVSKATMLEVGSGWYPTFPLCLYLAGAARVLTYDVTRNLRPKMARRLVARLAHHVRTIAKVSGANESEVEARRGGLSRALGLGASLSEATGQVVDYRAPADAADTGLPGGAIDIVFSNSVLEHVQPASVNALFRESARVLRPGGVMFHSVNCGDHFAYTDSSIDQLHYLQYSEQRWTLWNNAFLYQNRLRAIDFTEAARAVGFAIERDTSRASPQRLAQLERINVDPCFAGYTREQLAITSIDFVARKPLTR